MKGFNQVYISNRGWSVLYRGEHYCIKYAGKTVRMTKEKIIKKLHLHADALDRYVGGGFIKKHAMADEDIIRVKRDLYSLKQDCFFTSVAIFTMVQLVYALLVRVGFIDKDPGTIFLIQLVCFIGVLASVILPGKLADKFDFILGIEREG